MREMATHRAPRAAAVVLLLAALAPGAAAQSTCTVSAACSGCSERAAPPRPGARGMGHASSAQFDDPRSHHRPPPPPTPFQPPANATANTLPWCINRLNTGALATPLTVTITSTATGVTLAGVPSLQASKDATIAPNASLGTTATIDGGSATISVAQGARLRLQGVRLTGAYTLQVQANGRLDVTGSVLSGAPAVDAYGNLYVTTSTVAPSVTLTRPAIVVYWGGGYLTATSSTFGPLTNNGTTNCARAGGGRAGGCGRAGGAGPVGTRLRGRRGAGLGAAARRDAARV
jgi:hypothetical protein